MAEKTKIKALFFITIAFIVCVFVYSLLLKKNYNYEAISSKIENNLAKIEKNIKNNLNQIKPLFINESYFKNPEILEKKISSSDAISYFVFKNDSLVFWSSTKFPIDKYSVQELKNSNIIHSSNGWYRVLKNTDGNFSFFGLYLIKSDYVYENEFLANSINKEIADMSLSVSLSFEKGQHNIFSSDNDFLFSITYTPQIKLNEPHQTLLFAIFLICFVLVISSFWKAIFLLLKNPLFTPFVKFCLWVFISISLRILLFFYGFPNIFYELDIFSPHYFASSNIFPSLGDLILNVVLFFSVCFCFCKTFNDKYNYNILIYKKYFITLITIPLLFLMYLSLYQVFEKIILNSNIFLLFNNFSELSVYSFWVVLVFFLIFAGFFYLTYCFINYVYHLLQTKKTVLILYGISALTSIFTIYIFNINIDFYYFAGILLFVSYIFYNIIKGFSPHKTRNLIIYSIFFSILTTYLVYKFSDIKEKEQRKILAVNLASDNDPVAEYLFYEFKEEILNDSILKNYLLNHIANETLIKKYLSETYFNSYWSKYDLHFRVCSEYDELLVKPGNISMNCNDIFSNLIFSSGKTTHIENFYQINQTAGRSYYLAILPVIINTEGECKTVYIEMISKFIPKQLGYPELLIDNTIKVNKKILNYNYAKYKNAELILQYGKFFYYINSVNYKVEKKNFTYFDLDGYNHLFYNAEQETEIIISKKNTDIMDVLASFSYLFIIFLFLWFFLKLTCLSQHIVHKDFFNFTNRVRFALVFIVLLSFITIGIVTLRFIVNLHNNKNYDNISEKAHSILIEVENKLSYIDEFTPEIKEYASELLIKFANVFFTDINLYDLEGKLIASSRQKVFSEGLISQRMNPLAFYNMTGLSKTFYIHEENIGSLRFLSAYIPFRNNDNKCIAYINLPYFAKQNEQRKEISTFLAAFINIYVLLIAFSVIIAVLISRYVTKPLKLIKEKLSSFKLGKTNEKILWKRNDEIGSLVYEYNRLIDELAKSVELLAQTERESAWREMAKQVAHEIKNPLTPMKLSVQHMQRSLKENPELIDEKLEKFTKMMIDEIDTLSSIATSFSDFARMPVAKNTVIELQKLIIKTIVIYEDISEVKIIFKHSAERIYYVFADEMQLKRAFDNIIRNSMQAINKKESGIIEIAIEKDNNNYVIAFKDNGMGISDDEAHKIFTPNFTTKTSGMGLGLAIVKNIIEGFGGSVSFTSEHGKGTTFWISLPVFENENQQIN